jgi:hypothetical protein
MESAGFWQSFRARATWGLIDSSGGPLSPQNLATPSTRLCLATTVLKLELCMCNLWSEVCVCVWHGSIKVYIGVQGRFSCTGSRRSKEVEGRATTTWLASQLVPLIHPIRCINILPRGLGNVSAKFGSILCQLKVRRPQGWSASWPLSSSTFSFGPRPLHGLYMPLVLTLL